MLEPRLALSLALLFLGAPTEAQCLGVDGLGGPCWTPASANLPTLPAISQSATAICWDDCSANPQVCAGISIDPPVEVACGRYTAGFFTTACSFGGLVGGVLELDYTRTWFETTPFGRRLQVYRFLAKTDAVPGAVALPPCAVPACLTSAGGQPSAFYYGYVDYAFDCVTNQVESALALFHACDAFVHVQGLSSRPGTYHPGRSYALVSPSSAANPFVAGDAVPFAGVILAEGTRNVPQSAGALCTTEDRLFGDVAVIGSGCACAFAFLPRQATARRLAAGGTCVGPSGATTSVQSVDTRPGFPWPHHLSVSLGSWTTDATYPGRERLWADEGAFLVRDAAPSGGATTTSFGEVYYGVSTANGFNVSSTGGTSLTTNLIDLASNASFALPGAPMLPLVGDVRPTRNLIYVNLP